MIEIAKQFLTGTAEVCIAVHLLLACLMHEAEQHVADHIELRARRCHSARWDIELLVLFGFLSL